MFKHQGRPFDVLGVEFVEWDVHISSVGDLRNSSANVMVKKEGYSPVRHSFVAVLKVNIAALEVANSITYTRLSGRINVSPFFVNSVLTRSNR